MVKNTLPKRGCAASWTAVPPPDAAAGLPFAVALGADRDGRSSSAAGVQ